MTKDSSADRQRKGKLLVRICMMPERNTRECVLLALGLRRSMRLRDRKHDLLEPTFLQGAGEMLLGGLELDWKDGVAKINPT